MTRAVPGNKLPSRAGSSYTDRVGRPRTRKAKPGETIPVSVNLDGAIVQALDEEAVRRSEQPGPAWTRTDVVRVLLQEWMASRTKSRGK